MDEEEKKACERSEKIKNSFEHIIAKLRKMKLAKASEEVYAAIKPR